MFARVKTIAFSGLMPALINIEVHISNGLPGILIVGLANKAVSEAKERVKAALHTMGIMIPAKKITVNLSPANVYKEGNHYDLGIALGILCVIEMIKQEDLENVITMGELSLNGEIKRVSGVLSCAYFASENKYKIIAPQENFKEARFALDSEKIISENTILDVVKVLNSSQKKTEIVEEKCVNINRKEYKNFKDIRGQMHAKHAFEIASIGGHGILMIGRPGSGKSMLAERLPSILPPLSTKELLEVSIIKSINGVSFDADSLERPFRSPHHSSSMVSLIGGGRNVKPGEVTLAHNGVLFLDEFAEFPSFVLDALRQPMETNEVNIARAEGHVSFPCRFQLIAAMNPCKCGYLGDSKRECSRVPLCGKMYLEKISGPILERIDIHIDVNPSIDRKFFEFEEVEEESSEDIRRRVLKVREFIALQRGQKDFNNAGIPVSKFEEFCKLSAQDLDLLNSVALKFNLSLRQCHKIIRLARTIADMEFKHELETSHLIKALSFRPKQ